MSKTYDFPTEVIELPSKGLVYPEDSPLSDGTIEIKYMTAKEEEILASRNLIKKGLALDKLFESVIVGDVDPSQIILGDKNAIMLATRVLAYGPEYKIEVTNEFDEKEEIVVDLKGIPMKDIDDDKLNRKNLYEFETPFGKNKLVFKLLTHGDEKQISQDIKAQSRLNKNAPSAELTTRYRYMIESVDGDDSIGAITSFISNKFITRDTKAFRMFVKSIQPDVEMNYDYINSQTGEKEVRPIPMGANFFWPSE